MLNEILKISVEKLRKKREEDNIVSEVLKVCKSG